MFRVRLSHDPLIARSITKSTQELVRGDLDPLRLAQNPLRRLRLLGALELLMVHRVQGFKLMDCEIARRHGAGL